MAYEAIVARVSSIHLIENSDKIKLATISGYQIIVGLDITEGDIGLLFEEGGALDSELLSSNDLIRRRDENGEPAGGFFEANGRIRAIRMRGTKSEGFFGPLSLVTYTGYDISKLKEGDRFSELNSKRVCGKYYTPATIRAMQRGGKAPRSNDMFAKHVDTENIKKVGKEIPRGSIIHLSEKLHGSSQRTMLGLEEVELELNRFQRFFYKLLHKATHKKEWVYLLGTRNVILGKTGAKNYYEDEGFRSKATKELVLRKGEVLYGEMVGYESVDKPIMAQQNLSALKNRSLEKRFGKTITYSYGQLNGTSKFYVYRITLVNEDGCAVELSKVQVDQRAKELGVSVVPHVETFIYDGNLEGLLAKLDKLVDGEKETPASSLDSSHLQEGIVIRAESELGTKFYKAKSCDFFIAEGIQREDAQFVDSEEIS